MFAIQTITDIGLERFAEALNDPTDSAIEFYCCLGITTALTEAQIKSSTETTLAQYLSDTNNVSLGEISGATEALDNLIRVRCEWKDNSSQTGNNFGFKSSSVLCKTFFLCEAHVSVGYFGLVPIAGASTGDNSSIYIPSLSETIDSVFVEFNLSFQHNGVNVISVTPDSQCANMSDLSSTESDIRANMVTTHSESDSTAGDAQTILGEKTFSSPMTCTTVNAATVNTPQLYSSSDLEIKAASSSGNIILKASTSGSNTWIYFNGDVLKPDTSSCDLGTSSGKWANVYAININATTVNATTVNATTVSGTTLGITSTNALELKGSSVKIIDSNGNNGLTWDGGALTPGSTTYNLGSSSYPFANIYGTSFSGTASRATSDHYGNTIYDNYARTLRSTDNKRLMLASMGGTGISNFDPQPIVTNILTGMGYGQTAYYGVGSIGLFIYQKSIAAGASQSYSSIGTTVSGSSLTSANIYNLGSTANALLDSNSSFTGTYIIMNTVFWFPNSGSSAISQRSVVLAIRIA